MYKYLLKLGISTLNALGVSKGSDWGVCDQNRSINKKSGLVPSYLLPPPRTWTDTALSLTSHGTQITTQHSTSRNAGSRARQHERALCESKFDRRFVRSRYASFAESINWLMLGAAGEGGRREARREGREGRGCPSGRGKGEKRRNPCSGRFSKLILGACCGVVLFVLQ